jgi:hypothetical protein
MRAVSTLLSIVGGAATAVLILACSPSPSMIAPDVAERAITQGLTIKGLEIGTVACPGNHAAKAGETFTCTATSKDGDIIPVDVVVLDEAGRVSWDVRGVVVHEKLMAEGITAKNNGAITVKCPDKVIVVAVGGTFTCEAGSGGTMQHIEIRIEDKEGNETWKLKP